jgi:hypothetical protein
VSSIGCSETAQPPWQVFGGENDDNLDFIREKRFKKIVEAYRDFLLFKNIF